MKDNTNINTLPFYTQYSMSEDAVLLAYLDVCEDLADAVNRKIFEERDLYWVGDNIGGLVDFGDTDFLTPEEMVLILLNDVSYEQYAEWRDASIAYNENRKEKKTINLKSWLMGARYTML